jgi:hypothetical protein
MATDKTTTPTPRTLKMWFNVEKVNTECDLVIDGLDDSGKFIYVPFTTVEDTYNLTFASDMHRLFARDIQPFWSPYGFAAGTFELEQWYIQIAFRPIDRVIDKRNSPSVVYMTVVGDGAGPDGVWDVPVDRNQVYQEYCRAFCKFYNKKHKELADVIQFGEDDFVMWTDEHLDGYLERHYS